jgi:hypothetical protein
VDIVPVMIDRQRMLLFNQQASIAIAATIFSGVLKICNTKVQK